MVGITLCFIHNDFVHAAAGAISRDTLRDTAVGRDALIATEHIKVKKHYSYPATTQTHQNPRNLEPLRLLLLRYEASDGEIEYLILDQGVTSQAACTSGYRHGGE